MWMWMCVCVRVRIANEINWFIWNCFVCPTWATYFKNTINELLLERRRRQRRPNKKSVELEQKWISPICFRVSKQFSAKDLISLLNICFDLCIKYFFFLCHPILLLANRIPNRILAYTLARQHTSPSICILFAKFGNADKMCFIRHHNKENWIHKRENFMYWQSKKKKPFCIK